ncbi:hypothetical protein ACH41H_44970 [Streptomyces sp. NPDC020800]|uniref:hypothetical protein n=1 Tax=Streptomyces sp. NPDC020800 TaxID=3365092 RepID=UPI0037A4B4EC
MRPRFTCVQIREAAAIAERAGGRLALRLAVRLAVRLALRLAAGVGRVGAVCVVKWCVGLRR